jgi:hypothetical protein
MYFRLLLCIIIDLTPIELYSSALTGMQSLYLYLSNVRSRACYLRVYLQKIQGNVQVSTTRLGGEGENLSSLCRALATRCFVGQRSLGGLFSPRGRGVLGPSSRRPSGLSGWFPLFLPQGFSVHGPCSGRGRAIFQRSRRLLFRGSSSYVF